MGRLGRILVAECQDEERFVDLFSGSGSVSHFVAERVRIPVLSVDLQVASAVLSGAVIERTEPFSDVEVMTTWCKQVREDLDARNDYETWTSYTGRTRVEVERARVMAAGVDVQELSFTHQYGGHYFSPSQTLELDYLFSRLPTREPHRTVALGALIRAASRCAASPGHTAQPFQPTPSLLPYIQAAWRRSMLNETQAALEAISRRHALVEGAAVVGRAEEMALQAREGDVVFCDPPYSAVQYSRFYHVLEGIARGGWTEVGGRGRAPAAASRASSDFSLKRRADGAMRSLLEALHERGCSKVIVTFPNATASNGLSARSIASYARAIGWKVRKALVDSTHSTLGGLNDGGIRGSRKDLKEALFVLDRV
jgi:adenine-specific DNA-methyltransferase